MELCCMFWICTSNSNHNAASQNYPHCTGEETRCRKVEWPAQGHRASACQSRDWVLGQALSEVFCLFPTLPRYSQLTRSSLPPPPLARVTASRSDFSMVFKLTYCSKQTTLRHQEPFRYRCLWFSSTVGNDQQLNTVYKLWSRDEEA